MVVTCNFSGHEKSLENMYTQHTTLQYLWAPINTIRVFEAIESLIAITSRSTCSHQKCHEKCGNVRFILLFVDAVCIDR